MPRGDDKDKDADGRKGGSPAPPKFCDNERVLCFHGPLIYEGKVLKLEYRENEKEYAYWIHYAGWSKSWDEWVYERRVLKYSEQNLEKQKQLKIAHEETIRLAKSKSSAKSVSKKKSQGSDTSSVILSTTDSRASTPVLDQKTPKGKTVKVEPTPIVEVEPPRRRKKNECVEPEGLFAQKQEVHIMIPEQLKIFLVDDWDTVTRQKRLVNLPARISIEQIFEDYVKEKKKKEPVSAELCDGLRNYFNLMLGPQLLYRFEKVQLEQILMEIDAQPENEKKNLTDYYGAHHLMRLFTKLGCCLTYTNLDYDAIETLRKYIEDLFKFLLKNFDKYFSLEDYGTSTPDYQRKPT